MAPEEADIPKGEIEQSAIESEGPVVPDEHNLEDIILETDK